MRVVDVLLAIPALLLSLALVTALGFGTVNVAIAVGRRQRRELRPGDARGGAAGAADRRTSRPRTLVGARWCSMLRRHVLPNAAGPVLVLAALEFGLAVLAVSSLSFLGYGAPPPAPEWGSLVAEGRNYLATAWWLTALPGLMIAAIVLAGQPDLPGAGRRMADASR